MMVLPARVLRGWGNVWMGGVRDGCEGVEVGVQMWGIGTQVQVNVEVHTSNLWIKHTHTYKQMWDGEGGSQ